MNKISELRLLNTRAWASARIGELSAADVIVGAIDEALEARRAVTKIRDETSDTYIVHQAEVFLAGSDAYHYCPEDYENVSRQLFAARQAILKEGLLAERFRAALVTLRDNCIESEDYIYAEIATKALDPNSKAAVPPRPLPPKEKP